MSYATPLLQGHGGEHECARNALEELKQLNLEHVEAALVCVKQMASDHVHYGQRIAKWLDKRDLEIQKLEELNEAIGSAKPASLLSHAERNEIRRNLNEQFKRLETKPKSLSSSSINKDAYSKQGPRIAKLRGEYESKGLLDRRAAYDPRRYIQNSTSLRSMRDSLRRKGGSAS